MGIDQKFYGSLSAATDAVSFPATNLAVQEFVDESGDNAEVSGSFDVPGSSPYKVRMPLLLANAALTVTVDTNARTRVDGSTPGTGQFGVDRATGVWTFNAADSGGTVAWTATPYGSLVTSDFLHWLQEHVRQTQVEVKTKQSTNDLLTSIAGLTTAADKVLAFDGPDSAVLVDSTTTGLALLSAADAAAGRTAIAAANQEHGHTLADVTDAGTLAGIDADSIDEDLLSDVSNTRSLGALDNYWTGVWSYALKLHRNAGNAHEIAGTADGLEFNLSGSAQMVYDGDLKPETSGAQSLGASGLEWNAVLADLSANGSTAIIPSLMEEERFTDLAFNSGWNRKVSHEGNVSTFPHRLAVETGTVANGVAGAATSGSSGWFRGKNRNALNFSKRIKFRFSVAQYANTTNGQCWVSMGRDGFTGEGIGDPSAKAIGVRVDDDALKGIVHDGSTLTVVDLTTTLTGDELNDVVVDSIGDGNVNWYLNGSDTAAGTTANGPVGDATGSSFRIEADNGGDAANQAIILSTLTVYAEQ
jgi:hypothetical protein